MHGQQTVCSAVWQLYKMLSLPFSLMWFAAVYLLLWNKLIICIWYITGWVWNTHSKSCSGKCAFMLCSALLLSFSFRVHGSTLGRIIPAHPCTANRKPHGDQSNGNDAKGMLEGQLQTFTFLKSHQSLIKSIYFRTEIPSSLHSFTCNQCTPNTKSPKIQTFISACLLLRHSQSQMCSQRIIW